jgi:hypothetical protein
MAIKRCSEAFSVWQDGVPTVFTAGQLVDEKHPILKTHGHLFRDPETAALPQPAPAVRVEQATADPGEARTLTAPATPDGADDDAKPTARRGRRTK